MERRKLRTDLQVDLAVVDHTTRPTSDAQLRDLVCK
jgi:hypothetical protein